MNDSRAIETQWIVQVGLHLLVVHGHEQIGLINIPKHDLGLSGEIWDEDRRVINWVVEVSVTRVVHAHTFGSAFIWENLDDGVL